jgi:hypothetical protein
MLSPRKSPALILALTAASAYAEPYRNLPRFAPAEQKGRAAETVHLQQALAQQGPQAPAVLVKDDLPPPVPVPAVEPSESPAPVPALAREAESKGAITHDGDVNVIAIPPSAATPRAASASARVIPVQPEVPAAAPAATVPVFEPAPEPAVVLALDPARLEAEAARLAAESARLSRLAQLARAPGQVLALSRNELGHTVERTLDPTGRVIERTVDARGALVDANVVGNAGELPLVGELRDDAGTTVRVVRDASGALIDMVQDRTGKLLAVKVLGPGQAL